MLTTQTALHIAISNVKANRSAVAELILQQLETHGPISDASAGAPDTVDLLVTTGAEGAAKMVDDQDVLILDATEANKRSLLSEIGFHTSGDAWAYFVAKVGPRRYRVIELAKDDAVGVHEPTVTPLDQTQPFSAEFVRGATQKTVTHDRPDLAAEELVSTILDYRLEASGAVEGRVDGPVIPPNVKKWMVSYTLVKHQAITNFNKTQTASMSITYDIIAFLNNPPAGRHYQYVYMHQKGVVNPGTLMDYSTYYKGYGQFRVATGISPTSHLSDLVYDASSPPNVNDKRTIDSKIGISLEYTEKDGGHAKFDYEEGISQEVSDWQIVEQTTTSNMSWVFAERYPLNFLAMSCGADSGDSAPFDFWDRVKDFPNLTRYTLQPQTQSVWRTAKVLQEPVTFFASVTQTLMYFWYRFLWFECLPAVVYDSKSLTVDLSKVSE